MIAVSCAQLIVLWRPLAKTQSRMPKSCSYLLLARISKMKSWIASQLSLLAWKQVTSESRNFLLMFAEKPSLPTKPSIECGLLQHCRSSRPSE